MIVRQQAPFKIPQGYLKNLCHISRAILMNGDVLPVNMYLKSLVEHK